MTEADALPQHVLDGYSQGALFDMRLRFAMQMLCSPMTINVAEGQGGSSSAIRIVLDLSEELFRQAKERGMITPIDHDAPMPADLINQAKRLGAFQVWQQVGANEATKQAASPIATLANRRPLNG